MHAADKGKKFIEKEAAVYLHVSCGHLERPAARVIGGYPLLGVRALYWT